VGVGTVASVRNLVIGDRASPADRIDLRGGSLATAEWLVLGYGAGNAGTLVISNGTANVTGGLFVGLHGAGTINLTGGSLTVAGQLGIALNAGSTGQVALAGGTLTVGSIAMTADGRLDITAGTLLINGDATSIVDTYVSNGWITALGGAGTVVRDYNTRNPGKTTLTAVASPPPRQRVTGVTVSGGNATLTYETTAGHTYHLEATPVLSPASWVSVPGSATNAIGAPVTFTFPLPPGTNSMFYRTVSP
jgi:hypothetical protein